jgi:thiamine-monophosphate kinase
MFHCQRLSPGAVLATEFDLIRRYFTRHADSAVLGVGDDCALLQPRPGMQLAVSSDMLVEGRHFLPGTDARRLGHKTLAVNLSDLAAMGADARWALLAIALPSADEEWLEAFSAGFFSLAQSSGVDLVGGDTTRGPLCLSVTVIGELPGGLALRRDGARVADDVWVSGFTGEAALGLAHLQGTLRLPDRAAALCVERLEMPQPRLELGGRLRGMASAAIDVSDGLLADLGHVLQASGVGAVIEFDRLPRSDALRQCADAVLAEQCLLAGGDDYELLFTAPSSHRDEIAAIGADLGVPVTCIGVTVEGPGTARVVRADGTTLTPARAGFDHFSAG